MKTLLAWIILTSMMWGCAHKQSSKDDKLSAITTHDKTDAIFRQVADFPRLKDTTKFIADIRNIFKLDVDESPAQKANEKITAFKKLKIYGSDKEFFLIEYDYGAGSMASYPWKYQLLLTSDGRLVKVLSGQRFDLVTIFPNQSPFLLTVAATAKGNGGHEIYKMSADTLENVYEGYFDYALRTYDAHQDNCVYEPNELTLNIKDYNNDGLNDITFVGKLLFIQGQTKNGDWFDSETINGKTITYSVDNPFKEIPVEFVFIYNKQIGHFTAKEKYIEKYDLDDQ